MPIDVRWLVYKENQNMGKVTIPLDTVGSPPEYEKSSKPGVADAIHNHYYTQNQVQPWYSRKRCFYTAVGILVFIVVACAVVLGVVLKLESDKKAVAVNHDNATTTTKLSTSTVTTSSVAVTETSPSSTNSTTTMKHQPTAAPTSAKETTTAVGIPTPLAMSDKSQLASVFVKGEDDVKDRRILVRQENTDYLHFTEWTNGTTNYYRMKDKLGSDTTRPKTGTPLTMIADEKGLLHLFYLSKVNIICYVHETKVGLWKEGEVKTEKGTIRTSSTSGLFTTWHTGRNTPHLLVVAYDNPSQMLQLAIINSPSEKDAWYVADVTSVAVKPAPGQSNIPCYALAGDWHSKSSKRDADGSQNLLVGLLEENEVVAWECSLDYWPPPDLQVKCHKGEKAFQDDNGDEIRPDNRPEQLIFLGDPEQLGINDDSSSNYDFILLSVDNTNQVAEYWVGGGGKAQRKSFGIAAKSHFEAMSTTSDGLLFASFGKDVVAYGRQKTRWEYQKLAGILGR